MFVCLFVCQLFQASENTDLSTARLEVENWGEGLIHVDSSVLLLLKTSEIVHLNLWASSPNSFRKGSILNKIQKAT